MKMYEKEFEDYYDIKGFACCVTKKVAYDFWKHGQQHKPEPKKEKIELVGGDWVITGDNTTHFFVNIAKDRKLLLSGKLRKTQADAEKAATAMRKRDRLAAYVYEHCGHEGEWGRYSCWSIGVAMSGLYIITMDGLEPFLCKQYMPEKTAEWLCEKLNSGEIEL